MKDVYYIAANKYEGCGHRHRTEKAAARCIPHVDSSHGKVRVWPMPKHRLSKGPK
jgi:hypothetical protein